MRMLDPHSPVSDQNSLSLAHSYRYCGRVARRAASSFYWSFWLLPRRKRQGMCALYAFSRRTDDLGDNDLPVETRRQQLAAWRNSLNRALASNTYDDPLLPALADTVRRFEIPHHYLADVITGVEMDLGSCRYETFDQLSDYCYHVAAAVGLACIHIWGFTGQMAYDPAVKCGLAFQMTNILRDLKEDAEHDRIYLPLEDFRRFGYEPERLKQHACDDRLRALLRFQVERTEQLYEDAAALFPCLTADGQRTLHMMTATYRRLLREIQRRNGDVFGSRVRLGWGSKLAIAARHLFPRNLTGN